MSNPASTHGGDEMPLRLSLELDGGLLGLVIENAASQPVRLWELHNSWGWNSVSILVRPTGHVPVIAIERAERDWTKDARSFATLAPGERLALPLDLHDGWWKHGGIRRAWRGVSLEVRARYQVQPTTESGSLHVLVGAVESDWVTSHPPHPWLFGTEESWPGRRPHP
jgi:hypothetical protein